MDTTLISTANWSMTAAAVALFATALSLAALIGLHVISVEYAPAWRMVSEYANGRAPWLLTIVFFTWALSSAALLVALWPISASLLGKIGLALLLLAAIGQTMGGLFDINHPLHGPAAMIGIPAVCAAAIVVTIALGRTTGITAPPIWAAHLPWISFVLMLAAFALFMAALSRAGVDLSAQNSPLQELPAGVTGYVGWANRLLFGASYLWVALTALSVLRAGR